MFYFWGLIIYPPASEASRGVYWNQAQKNFAHPYTEYPWVSVTLWLCHSVKILNDSDQKNFNIGQHSAVFLVCIDGLIGH